MRKRGQQSGTQASMLVILITIAIVIYVMFLPANERRDLLGDYNSTSNDHNNNDDDEVLYNKTIIEETPGRLDYLSETQYDHELPSINLLSKTDASKIKSFSPFIIRNNWFEKKFESLRFEIEDKDNTDNLQLSFVSKDHVGTLLITLNGKRVYENDLQSANIEPIKLPEEYLIDSNVIEFSVSSVGMAFWKTNKYSFENIIITGEITDTSGFDSRNIFTISSTEFYNLEQAELFFSTDCSPSQISKLTITINGENIYSGIPDCGQINPPIDITDSLKPKTNEIRFRNDKGQILIDQLRIKTDLKELPYPVYYFELQDEEYKDVIDEKAELNMTLYFTDEYSYKEARIYVNGIRTYMTTRAKEYTANLRPYLEEGSNSIKIEPYGDTLDIRKLIVHLD